MGMSIQAGTSHSLGQNFAKAFNVTFMDSKNTEQTVWGTSWGVSTRLIGALITALSDDDGLVLPPAVSPIQVVIVAVHAKEQAMQSSIATAVHDLGKTLEASGIRVHVDCRTDVKLVSKRFEWERKGVPLRLEVGSRDLDKGTAVAKLRTGGDRFALPLDDGAAAAVTKALEDARQALMAHARSMKERLTFRIASKADFLERLQQKSPGYLLVPWGGDSDDEEILQKETGATLRCIPFVQEELSEAQVCPLTGKKAREWVVFAKAY